MRRKDHRTVLKDFAKAGLEIEVVSRSKHYMIYHKGDLVYKFSHGKSSRNRDQRNRAALIRGLQAADAQYVSL